MKDKQKNHQQHPRTSQQHQLSTHFLVLTSPSPLRLYGILMSHFLQPTGNAVSCIMIWTFHTPDMDNLEKSIHYDFFCFLYSFFPLVVLIIFRELKFGRKKSSSVLNISNYSFKTITVFENFELAKFRHSETTRIACWFAVVKLGI